MAREAGLLRLGTMSIDGTKIDAKASKIRSVRYDRATELRAKLAADISALTARAEAADVEATDPQSLPDALARRETLLAKLDAACARLEADARAEAEAARPAYEAKKAAYDTRKGRRGRRPKPPDDAPPPERQSNLTDPDSALMRRSDAHEYRQAYNAQAVVCAEGSQLILATNLVASPSDAPSFAPTVLGMQATIGLPTTVLADTGFASGPAVADLRAHGVDPLVAIGRIQSHRPYDFRPPPEARARKTPARTLEDRDESHAGDRRCESSLQTTQADRRTGVWDHQKCNGVSTLPSARPEQRRGRVDLDHSGLQLQARRSPEGRMRQTTFCPLVLLSSTIQSKPESANPTGC